MNCNNNNPFTSRAATNKRTFNQMGPLIQGFSSIVNTTVLQDLQLVEFSNTEEPRIK